MTAQDQLGNLKCRLSWAGTLQLCKLQLCKLESASVDLSILQSQRDEEGTQVHMRQLCRCVLRQKITIQQDVRSGDDMVLVG